MSIPSSVQFVGNNAFAFCKALNNIVYDSAYDIPENFAIDCIALNNVNIKSSIKSIGNNAFMNCFKLRDLILPDSLKVIKEEAFRNDKSLENIVAPASLTDVLERAFCDCSNLRTIDVSNCVNEVYWSPNSLYGVHEEFKLKHKKP